MGWVSAASKLDEKRLVFCHEYRALGFNNGHQAIKNAGMRVKNPYSRASQLLAEPDVQAYIRELRDELLHDANIRAEDLIQELKAVAFSNGADFAEIKSVSKPTEEGATVSHREVVFKPFDELNPSKLKAVSEVGERRTKWGSQVYVRTHDKLGAIRQLREMAGLNAPTEVNQNIKADVQAEVQGSFSLKRRHRRPQNENEDGN